MVSAYTRHICDMDVKLKTSEDATQSFTFKLRKFANEPDFSMLESVMRDFAEQDREAYTQLKESGIVAPILQGPGSMTDTVFFDELQDAQHAHDSRTLIASLFNKAGENGDWARFITMPDIRGSEKAHQARASSVIHVLKAVHKHLRHHRNVKGLSENMKRVAFGEFLANTPKDYMIFGSDKKSNDRCWTAAHWTMFCEDVERVIGDDFYVFTKTYFLAGGEELDTIVLKQKFVTFIVEMCMLYFMSGINPTAFGNRIMSEAEEGTICRSIYGEEAYQKWLEDRKEPKDSERLEWLSNWKYGKQQQPTITLGCPTKARARARAEHMCC